VDPSETIYLKGAASSNYRFGPLNVTRMTNALKSLKLTSPLPKILQSPILTLIANHHAHTLAQEKLITHNGVKGISVMDRFLMYGNRENFKNIGESILAINCKDLAHFSTFPIIPN
jgi:uncharacterized protein YkwD